MRRRDRTAQPLRVLHYSSAVNTAVDSAGRSVGAGRRNSACIAGTGIVPARGHPAWTGLQRRLPCAGRIQVVERGADPAAGKQPRHCSRHRGRDPELAASGRRYMHAPAMPPSPRVGDPLHPMVARHAAGQKQGRDYRDHPARQRKPFSRPRPRRLKGPSLILSVARQDRVEAARLLCNFHACGPAPGSMPGSVGAQVLTFGMSSQRVV